jgi:ABC-type cobalamin/Fe3+-siderophores transport system ATPase subunit
MKRTGIIELADHDITQASGGQLQRAAIGERGEKNAREEYL